MNTLFDRRELLRTTGMIMFAGTVVQLLPYGKGKALASITDPTGEIARNHGHIAVIPESSLGLEELTIDIKGQATHSHLIVLNKTQLDTLAQHKELVVTSTTTNNHSHTVTFFAVPME